MLVVVTQHQPAWVTAGMNGDRSWMYDAECWLLVSRSLESGDADLTVTNKKTVGVPTDRT